MGIVDRIIKKRVSKLSAEEIKDLTVAKLDTLYTNYNSSEYYGGSNVRQKDELESNPAAFVHRHTIIEKRAFFIDDAYHRNLMFYYHEWVGTPIKRIAAKLTSETPLFCKPGTENDEEPEILENIAKFWKNRRLNEALEKAFKKDAVHGISLLIPFEIPADWYSGPPWKVYSWDEIVNESTEYKFGHPVKFQINPTNKHLEPFEISITEGIFHDSSNSDDFNGTPIFTEIWDNLVDFLFISDAINSFDQRMGNGFMVIAVPISTTDTQIKQIESKVKNIRTEKGIVVRTNTEEPVVIDWMKMGSVQVDFISHLNRFEGSFVRCYGFPKRFLFGDPEGAQESSGKDMLQINKRMKEIFSKWIVWIKKMLRFYGLIENFDDVVVKSPFKMDLSEQEIVMIENMKTQTIAAKTWLTVNEKRKLDGYEPLSQDEEEKVLGISSNDNNYNENDNENDNTNSMNDKEENAYDNNQGVKRDALENFIFKNSLKDIAKTLGVSLGTAYKIRAKFDDDIKPKIHLFDSEITCKTDSVESNLAHFRGVLLTPVSSENAFEYEEGIKDIRNAEEIRKWFNGNTVKTIYGTVNSDDSHYSPIGADILRQEAVAIADVIDMDDSGKVFIDGKISLDAVDEKLGPNNWVRDYVSRGLKIPISVALYSRDRYISDKLRENTELDVRSFVLTRVPRNNQTYIQTE